MLLEHLTQNPSMNTWLYAPRRTCHEKKAKKKYKSTRERLSLTSMILGWVTPRKLVCLCFACFRLSCWDVFYIQLSKNCMRLRMCLWTEQARFWDLIALKNPKIREGPLPIRCDLSNSLMIPCYVVHPRPNLQLRHCRWNKPRDTALYLM